MATINGIPVFEALLDEGCGMQRVSLVDDPAMLSSFQVFAQQEAQALRYAVADEEKRLIWGVLLRADFPIYRCDPGAGEYYIIYKADTIRRMAERYLAEGRQNAADLMHDGVEVEGVGMVQFVIKDAARGIVPAGFDEVADGSLFAEYHVTNDAVWAQVKDGTFRGFSIETLNILVPASGEDAARAAESETFSNNSKSISRMSKIKKTLLAAMKALTGMKFGALATDKALLIWDGEDDLAVEMQVRVEDEEGNEVAAPDGEYTDEEGRVIVVADGRVTEIREPESEEPAEPAAEGEAVEAAEEPEAPAEPEEDPMADIIARIDALEARIADLEAQNASQAEEMAALKAAPAAESAREAYRKAPEHPETLADKRKKFMK